MTQKTPQQLERRGPGRTLVIGATIVSLLLAAAAIVAAASLKSVIRQRAIDEAERRGIDIDPRTVDVWFGSATLTNTVFSFQDVPGLHGRATTIDVLLDGLTPTRIDANGIEIQLVGSAADLALQASVWTAKHPDAYAAPFSAKQIHLRWQSAPDGDAWLSVDGGRFYDSAGGLRFETTSASLLGVPIGPVGASWSTKADAARMYLGASDPESAPLVVTVHHASAPPTAEFWLRPTPLDDLSAPLGVTLPVSQDVMAEGTVNLTFENGFDNGPIDGTLEAKLEGYVPPHPVELDGFFFGSATTLATKLAISADRKTVTLSDTRVAAGAFGLSGSGSIERREDHATISMALGGSLPCTKVAESAAKARAGSVLGKLVGDAAKRLMKGAVRVHVELVADTRELERARVTRSIGIGCGLRPLDLSDLAKLGLRDRAKEIADQLSRDVPELQNAIEAHLPGAVEELSKHAPALPSALPSLPSALPPIGLPKLPEPSEKKQPKPGKGPLKESP